MMSLKTIKTNITKIISVHPASGGRRYFHFKIIKDAVILSGLPASGGHRYFHLKYRVFQKNLCTVA